MHLFDCESLRDGAGVKQMQRTFITLMHAVPKRNSPALWKMSFLTKRQTTYSCGILFALHN